MLDAISSKQTDKFIQVFTVMPPDVFLATAVGGEETMSHPYAYQLSLISTDHAITPADMLGTVVHLRIKIDKQQGYRDYSGYVMSFSAAELNPKRDEYRSYNLKIVPWLGLLDQGFNCRIFQQCTVLQVLDRVLAEEVKNRFGGAAADFYSLRVNCTPDYPLLDYCVQYRETNFNFVCRLMERNGLFYWFEQDGMRQRMIIADSKPFPHCPQSPVAFKPSKDARMVMTNWSHDWEPRTRQWTSRDRDYRSNPPLDTEQQTTTLDALSGDVFSKHFDYPTGASVVSDLGDWTGYIKRLTRYQLEEAENRFETLTGNITAVSVTVGQQLRLIQHPGAAKDKSFPLEEEREYLVTAVKMTAVETTYTEERAIDTLLRLVTGGAKKGGSALPGKLPTSDLPDVNKAIDNLPKLSTFAHAFGLGFVAPFIDWFTDWASPVLAHFPIIGPLFRKPPPAPFTGSCTLVPLAEARQFRAATTASTPRVQGPQTARVVGPDGVEIHTDELGRIRVKFDWDRTEPGATPRETDSGWLRVAQGWGGPTRGFQFLPRVGDEVLVEFLDGDPDRPIVVGCVYNALQMPPLGLTKYKNQSGIKTRTTPAPTGRDKYNMLRFDDTAGQEQVLVRSQRRLDVRAFGSMYETCSGSRNEIIGWKDPDSGKQGGDQNTTIGNDRQVHVQGGLYQRVEKVANITVIGDVVLDLEATLSLLVGTKAELNAQQINIEAKNSISLKVGGSCVVLDASGVTIVGAQVNINSGGSGVKTGDPTIEDPVDAAASDTGEPGWLEKHKGHGGGGRKQRQLHSQHAPPAPLPTQRAASPGAAPATVQLPPNVNKAMQDAFGNSFPGGRSQEQDGTLVRDADGNITAVNPVSGTSGASAPDRTVGADQTVVGTFHTHPYDATEGGDKGVSFSDADISYAAAHNEPILVDAGNKQFMITPTDQTPPLDQNQVKQDWKTAFDQATANGKSFPDATRDASAAVAKKNNMAYYEGENGTLDRVD